MTAELQLLLWPAERPERAVAALARACGLRLVAPPTPPAESGREALESWLHGLGSRGAIDLQASAITYREFDRHLPWAAPALLLVPPRSGSGGEPVAADADSCRGILLVLECRRSRCVILGPDLARRKLPLSLVRARLSPPASVSSLPAVEPWMQSLAPGRRRRVGTALRDILAGAAAEVKVWTARTSPSSPLRDQLRESRAWADLALIFAAHAGSYIALVLSWWLIGRAAFAARFDIGAFAAWILALASIIPLRMVATWRQGRLAVGLGARLQRLLLFGALRMDPDRLRRDGVGGLMGRVSESRAVGDLALGAGLSGLLATAELLVAAWVLAVGAGGWGHTAALAVWVALTVAVALVYAARRRRWTDQRIELTLDLVERMAGHRTRLVQEAPERWHLDEDRSSSRYLLSSSRMDRAAGWLLAVAPRGFVFLSLAYLTPRFVAGGASRAAIAVALGGVFLARGALQRLSEGAVTAAGAWIAMSRVRPFYDAATAPPPPVAAERSDGCGASSPAAELVIHDVSYCHQGRVNATLTGCRLAVSARDRVLVEGPSGAGKSTLASIMAGLRSPGSGLVLLGGLDRHTLGAEGFRRRVLLVPQFHDNYLLTSSFGFNLTLGSRKPFTGEEERRARSICVGLGLGELLDRMPGGFDQMVGESGWQLSHGERSRLYIARALLQDPDVMIVDESFAALDPENLKRCLHYTRTHARGLVVIAHP